MRKSGLLLLATSLLIGAGTPSLAAGPAKLSVTEKNREIVTEYARLRGAGRTYEGTEKFATTGNIEHNPEIAEGMEGDKSFLENRRKAHPDKYDTVDKYVNVVHNVLADGDLVAVKSHLFASRNDPGREFLDMWRVENGKFVEHWDIIQPISREAIDRGMLACGAGLTYEAAKALKDTADNPTCGKSNPHADSKANRKLVLDYLKLEDRAGKQAKSAAAYVSPGFVQHSPEIAPGRKGLLAYLAANRAARRTDGRMQYVRHVIADGDLVMVHRWVTTRSNPRGTVYIDLFRVKRGKIGEQWQIVQPVPPFSVAGRSMTGGADTPLEPDRRKGSPDQ